MEEVEVRGPAPQPIFAAISRDAAQNRLRGRRRTIVFDATEYALELVSEAASTLGVTVSRSWAQIRTRAAQVRHLYRSTAGPTSVPQMALPPASALVPTHSIPGRLGNPLRTLLPVLAIATSRRRRIRCHHPNTFHPAVRIQNPAAGCTKRHSRSSRHRSVRSHNRGRVPGICPG